MNTQVNVADIRWKTHHCILGFAVMGVWPPYSDGTDINALDVSTDKNIVVTANDDQGLVRLFNYPCIIKNAPAKEYTGHTSHVTNVRFLKGDNKLMTIGGNDGSCVLWDVVATPSNPDSFK